MGETVRLTSRPYAAQSAEQVLLGGRLPLQCVQQGGEGGVACRRVVVRLSGALRGRGDALLAEAADALYGLLGAVREEVRAAAAEPSGQVPQDVRGVRAHGRAGPGVAEHRRRGRAGVLVRAGLVQRTQLRVPPVRGVGHGGQQGHREDVVEAEQAVRDGDPQTERTRDALTVRGTCLAAHPHEVDVAQRSMFPY
ncbi:hypothetical protein ADL12_43575 [Streptomyces regalis]|uniref:Uncharacterized protein n=1 Tax=Streptomyces regalis TaxID=68262 RepID=A0A117MKB9_9ACTN|nr:hypothetical protein ADL12_43575 [Streptomyces regalis]